MRWNSLFVCDNIFTPITHDFELLCDVSQMKTVIRAKLEALDDDKQFAEYLSNQAAFEEILQLCMYAISFEGRDTQLVVKSANLLREILINIWNRKEPTTVQQQSPSNTSVHLTRLSLGEYLLKMFEGSARLHPNIPVFVLYESSYYTKLILKYLVYAFVPVSSDLALYEQQSRVCVDLLLLLSKIVSISESLVLSKQEVDPNNDQRMLSRRDSLLLYNDNVIVDEELLHLITDFFVVAMANWSCQRLQHCSINVHADKIDHAASYMFGSLLHTWFTMSIRAFPVSTQWKNLRSLLFTNLYRPSVVGEWSKVMIFLTRLLVMRMTIDCESLTSSIRSVGDCERVTLGRDDGTVLCNSGTLSTTCYNSAGAGSTFRSLFSASSVSKDLAYSTVILQLWFRFLFMFDDPSYFMNTSHYFQDSFIITDREGVLDLNNIMIETCAQINKNTMSTYFPILEKNLPVAFNYFVSTIEVIINTLFLNQDTSNYESDASLESVLSLSDISAKIPSKLSTTNQQPDNTLHSAVDDQLLVAKPDICVSSLVKASSSRLPPPSSSSNAGSSHVQQQAVSKNLALLLANKVRLSLDGDQANVHRLTVTNENAEKNVNADAKGKKTIPRGHSAFFINRILGQNCPEEPSLDISKAQMSDCFDWTNNPNTDPTEGDQAFFSPYEHLTLPTGHSQESSDVLGRRKNRANSKLSTSNRPISSYVPPASKLKRNMPETTSGYDHSLHNEQYELGGFNMKKLINDVNVRMCLAGHVKADSIVKLINPWLTNFLIPSFHSTDNTVVFHQFLLEKACILLTDTNSDIYNTSGWNLNTTDNAHHCNQTLLYETNEVYSMAKSSLFQKVQSSSSLVNEDWVYLAKTFSMKNPYELGRSTIIKLVCYLLCDFATSYKMSTHNLINMYTLINIGMCYQLADLKASYMLIPMTYSAINVILTSEKFNEEFQLRIARVDNRTADEANENPPPPPPYEESNTNGNRDLSYNTLKTLLSLLNFPFHEYSLLFNVERLKNTHGFSQLTLLSKKHSNTSLKYCYINSALVQLLLHTLRVFMSDVKLSSNYSIVFSCISSLFLSCSGIQQRVCGTRAKNVIVTAENYNESFFADATIESTTTQTMPSNCIESKDIFKMSVEVVTEILEKISTQKQRDLNVAISVVNFVSALSRSNVLFLDRTACLTLIAKICDFIHVQANKAPIYHNKQLHSTITASLLCISEWVLMHPWLMDDSAVRGRVLTVVELGIFGKVSKSSETEELADNKNAPSIEVCQSISFKVAEMAETITHLLACSRQFNKKSLSASQYDNTNEHTVLKHIQQLALTHAAHTDGDAEFVYFVYQKSMLFSFIECPWVVEELNDSGQCAKVIKPRGLIICRSYAGKKVFEVEFDPVGSDKVASYISSLTSYDDQVGVNNSPKIDSDSRENVDHPSHTPIVPQPANQPKEQYFHFATNNKPCEVLIPYSCASYESLLCNYISKDLFNSHKQRESCLYTRKQNISYLHSSRFKRPPKIHSKYNTLKMFLAQMNLIDSYCRSSSTSDGLLKHNVGAVERHDQPDQNEAKHSMVLSRLPSFNYRELQMIDTNDCVRRHEVVSALNELDNISTRRTETVLVFYVKQRIASGAHAKQFFTTTTTTQPDISISKPTSLDDSITNCRNTNISGGNMTRQQSFDNFLNSIGICVNSETHKKWAGIKSLGAAQTTITNFDFIYREDWTCEIAVIVDAWIPSGTSGKPPAVFDGVNRKDPFNQTNNAGTFPPFYSTHPNVLVGPKSFDGSIANTAVATKKAINDTFAVVWLDNFDYFEFIRIDQMVANLMEKARLDPNLNKLSYVIFLRHMKNGLVCIYTFHKSDTLWAPHNNSSIPSGLVAHPDNLTQLLFSGINSISILNKLTNDDNIDPLAKRKHYIQQLVNSLQQPSVDNQPQSKCVDALDFL